MGMRDLLRELDPDAEIVDAGDLEGMDKALEAKSALDMVIVDFQTPGFDGAAGIGRLREQQPGATIVVVASDDDLTDVHAAIDAGASGFMLKSMPTEVMLNALRLIQSGGVYLPASVLRKSPGRGLRAPRQRRYGDDEGGVAGLTPRQQDVLRLLAYGKSNKDIARELSLAEGTVKVHISAIFKALNVSNRTEAVIKATDLHGENAA
jgi:DNA-binding NarL/FixJ family response regulator